MANPNNLVKPPVLNNPAAPSTNSQLSLDDLTSLITSVASEVVKRQCPQLVQSVLNLSTDFRDITDQTIEDRHRGNLNDLDRVPDVVKILREFSGKAGEFNSWKKGVDRILSVYEYQKGTPKYFGIFSIIRNKIIGSADISLESYNTPLDWTAISKCLTMHYADKRDLSTLEYQLTTLTQGNSSIEEFYQKVYEHLSLMLNKLDCQDMGNEALHMLTQAYRNKALDTFIRGLNGELPKLLAIKEPSDLPQALQLCMKLENQNWRTAHTQHFKKPQQKGNSNYTKRTFYPQLAHMPQFNKPNCQYRQNNVKKFHPNTPPRPPKPQNRPEPMDVDQSMHSRHINYMNRPYQNNQNDFQGKRPHSIMNQQRKVQRTFHINTEVQQDQREQAQDSRNYAEPSDIHFLA